MIRLRTATEASKVYIYDRYTNESYPTSSKVEKPTTVIYRDAEYIPKSHFEANKHIKEVIIEDRVVPAS